MLNKFQNEGVFARKLVRRLTIPLAHIAILLQMRKVDAEKIYGCTSGNELVLVLPVFNEVSRKSNQFWEDLISKKNIDFIFVDDASTDNTYNLVKKYIIDLSKRNKSATPNQNINKAVEEETEKIQDATKKVEDKMNKKNGNKTINDQ